MSMISRCELIRTTVFERIIHSTLIGLHLGIGGFGTMRLCMVTRQLDARKWEAACMLAFLSLCVLKTGKYGVISEVLKSDQKNNDIRYMQ